MTKALCLECKDFMVSILLFKIAPIFMMGTLRTIVCRAELPCFVLVISFLDTSTGKGQQYAKPKTV